MKIFILITSLIIMSITVTTVFVGINTFSGVVVDDSYKAGLLWDKTRNKKAMLGWNVEFKNNVFNTGKNKVMFSLFDSNGLPLNDAIVSLTVSRPATYKYDRDYSRIKIKDNIYIANIDLPLHGLWDLIIKVTRNENNVVFKKRIYAQEAVSSMPAVFIKQSERAEDKRAVSLPITFLKHSKMAEIDCDIHADSCFKVITEDNIIVEFNINPKPVRSMSNLVFSITLKEKDKPISDANVEIDLTMPGMFMAKNRVFLKHKGNGRYEGKGVIVRCPSGKRIWKADVIIERNGKTASTTYVFEVKN